MRWKTKNWSANSAWKNLIWIQSVLVSMQIGAVWCETTLQCGTSSSAVWYRKPFGLLLSLWIRYHDNWVRYHEMRKLTNEIQMNKSDNTLIAKKKGTLTFWMTPIHFCISKDKGLIYRYQSLVGCHKNKHDASCWHQRYFFTNDLSYRQVTPPLRWYCHSLSGQ